MKNVLLLLLLTIAGSLSLQCCKDKPGIADGSVILFKNVNLIDGNGGSAVAGTCILIRGGRIAAIGKNLDTTISGQVIDLQGKTMMPALISTHVHIGTLKGTTTQADHYTRENILGQLKKYMNYGVSIIQVMGTDRPMFKEYLMPGYL